MATLAEAVTTLLNGDATLSALLTGGVFNAESFSFDGGGADEAPYESNGILIQPFAVVRFREADVVNPVKVGAEMQSVEVYIYDNVGYDTIESALSQIKSLLNFIDVVADDRSLAYFQCTHISSEIDAPELGNVPCKFIRFTNLQIRD